MNGTTGVTEGLPNTGADPIPWLALAYVSIAVGGGLLVVVRLRKPLLP